MSNRGPRRRRPAGVETGESADALRRSLRSLAGFIELGRRITPSDSEEHLYRQALLAAMGTTGSMSGAVFRLEGGGVALLDAFGPWGEPASRQTLGLDGPTRKALERRRRVRVLDEGEARAWREFCEPALEAFGPRLIVLLQNGGGETLGFVLLGERPDRAAFGDLDAEHLRAQAGLFAIVADRLAVTPRRRGSRNAPAHEHADENGAAFHPALRRFLGRSAPVQRILSDLAGVASTNCPLLLEGESGTGKELLAGIAHELSSAKGAPFEAISCGAIPETLIESELFGHVKGAFTGATRDHRGVFERGRGGTVFLDEIGEMPLGAQVKLLRVLQEGSFLPVGGEEHQTVDSRLIAATNRDLQVEVEAGRFRQDLFYRLNVFPMRLPPLRDRADDIPLLVETFLARHSADSGRRAPALRQPALRRLRVYSYPGNVRELQNIVRALLLEARGAGEITDKHVVAVFSRHRLSGLGGDNPSASAAVEPTVPREADEVGRWVLGELRRYYFNLALAERMLERRRRAAAERKSVPVYSRSGLTYYLQGECFRALAAVRWDPEAASKSLADGAEGMRRVRGKLDGFLGSALEALQDGGRTPASRLRALRARFAKLPGCYNAHLEKLATEFEHGRWRG